MTGYEGFPYLTFIEKNIQTELNNRSSLNNRIRNINAWVKVTSGVQKKGDSKLYSLQSVMSPDSSSVGYGFNSIYDNSTNRPIPGIISVDVQYKSKYGGVRIAQIKWQVNSLEQFHKYAPYFLNPGRTMLVEWGWSNPSTNVYALSRKEYEDLKSYKSFRAWEYLNNRSIKSNGMYDGMLGVVTNYDFSLRDDGGFDIMTEVMSQGAMMYGLNLVHQSNVADDGLNKDKYQTTIKDFIRDELEDVVNMWPVINDKLLNLIPNKKTSPDVDVYFDSNKNNINNKFITWGFIEDIIVNPWIGLKFGKKEEGANGKPMFQLKSIDTSDFYASANNAGFRSVKISNHKDLRTTNLSVCFINNKGCGVNDALKFDSPADGVLVDDKELETGYLRQIYVNYALVKDAFENSETLTDALLKILNQISAACIQYWDFNLKINEKDQTLRVIDANYTDKFLKNIIKNSQTNNNDIINNIYLFRLYGGNGIIKTINFSSKLSNDVTMTAIYANNKESGSNYIYNSDTDAFKSIWNDKNEYCDYFYDTIYYQTKDREDSLNPSKQGEKLKIASIVSDPGNEEYEGTTLINFLPRTQSSSGNEINTMKKLVYQKGTEENQKSNLLIPADFDMSIEGIGGLRIGDIFWVDAVPDMYIENGVFQITGVDHSIANNYWTTTIKAMLKVSNLGVSATNVKSNSKRSGVYTPKIEQINQIMKSVNPKTPDKSVLKWIKNNMGAILSSNQSGLYTEDILAGIMYTEASGPIYKFGVIGKMDAANVCSKIINPDAGSTAYSFFQFNYNNVPSDYKKWIDGGGWKRPKEATSRAVSLLKSKETYIKSSVGLTGNDLLKVCIASYNQGEGKSVRQIKAGTSIDLINPKYVTSVLNAAEEYKKI